MAEVGAKSYPPSSPVLSILNALGKSFFSGDQTDTEFRYTMILDPKGGSDRVNHFTLEVGNYVLVRMENRDEVIPWDELVLNENEAVLYWRNSDTKRMKRYTDASYLVIEVNKNTSYINVQLAENNFKGLIQSLEVKDKQKATDWKHSKDALIKVAIQKSQIINFNRAKKIIEELEIKSQDKVSKVINREHTKELLAMMANSVDKKGIIYDINTSSKTKSYDLSESQIRYLRDRLLSLKAEDINSTTYNLLDLSNLHNSAEYNQTLEFIAPLD